MVSVTKLLSLEWKIFSFIYFFSIFFPTFRSRICASPINHHDGAAHFDPQKKKRHPPNNPHPSNPRSIGRRPSFADASKPRRRKHLELRIRHDDGDSRTEKERKHQQTHMPRKRCERVRKGATHGDVGVAKGEKRTQMKENICFELELERSRQREASSSSSTGGSMTNERGRLEQEGGGKSIIDKDDSLLHLHSRSG